MLKTLTMGLAAATLLAAAAVAGTHAGAQKAEETHPPTATAATPTTTEETSHQAIEHARSAEDDREAEVAMRIRRRGATEPPLERARIEAQIEKLLERAHHRRSTARTIEVVARLAEDFRTSANVILPEMHRQSIVWDEWLVAHTLLANSPMKVTPRTIYQLRRRGIGWGQIAVGLGLRLGDVTKAVRAQVRIATGQAIADGKVAVIRPDEGTRLHGRSGAWVGPEATHADGAVGTRGGADAAAPGTHPVKTSKN